MHESPEPKTTDPNVHIMHDGQSEHIHHFSNQTKKNWRLQIFGSRGHFGCFLALLQPGVDLHQVVLDPFTAVSADSSSPRFTSTYITTGFSLFAKCLRHSVKGEKHSAKALPSATHDKEVDGKALFAFAECQKILDKEITKKFQKIAFFLIWGGAHRPAPACFHRSCSICRAKFMATQPIGYEPANSRPSRIPPSTTAPHYHLCLDSI